MPSINKTNDHMNIVGFLNHTYYRGVIDSNVKDKLMKEVQSYIQDKDNKSSRFEDTDFGQRMIARLRDAKSVDV